MTSEYIYLHIHGHEKILSKTEEIRVITHTHTHTHTHRQTHTDTPEPHPLKKTAAVSQYIHVRSDTRRKVVFSFSLSLSLSLSVKILRLTRLHLCDIIVIIAGVGADLRECYSGPFVGRGQPRRCGQLFGSVRFIEDACWIGMPLPLTTSWLESATRLVRRRHLVAACPVERNSVHIPAADVYVCMYGKLRASSPGHTCAWCQLIPVFNSILWVVRCKACRT